MSEVETKAKPEVAADNIGSAAVWSPGSSTPERPRRRLRIVPLLLTLAAVAIAGVLGSVMWDAYMGAPWTRDGTVRAYVVTMAPEVAGRIVKLPVADNQLVHRGDLLMVIDPTDYRIAVDLAEAAVQQAQVNAQNAALRVDGPQAGHAWMPRQAVDELGQRQAASLQVGLGHAGADLVGATRPSNHGCEWIHTARRRARHRGLAGPGIQRGARSPR